MAHPRDDERAEAMYQLYLAGQSLAGVASAFGVTRQSAYKTFRRRGLALRQPPPPRPTVTFNGESYALRDGGYYAKTHGDREYLHRDVWRHHFGPIPEGFDIHHTDENRANCDPGNLECLPKPEHTRRHGFRNNQFTKGRQGV